MSERSLEGPPERRRPRRLGRTAFYSGKVVLILVSALVLGAVGYGWATLGDINEGIVTTDVIDERVAAQPRPLDGAIDILLVGMDSRTDAFGNPLPREVLDMLHAGESDGERNTDTMILVHIPTDGRRAVAFSFPRDAWVELAGGYGKHRLNSAFAYAYNATARELGQQNKGDAKEIDKQATVAGRKNLIATIEKLIGEAVKIDRYAEVNLASFYEITKALGGVEVCLNAPVKEIKSGANFPAGKQTVDGAAALSFVRQRHDLPNNDLDRIVRQQVFLGALANKVLSANTLTDYTKMNELIAAVKKSVVLSTGWDITTFAEQMRGLSSGAIEFRTIPTQGPARIGGADVIRVDPNQVRDFIGGLATDDRKSTPSSSPVEPSGSPTAPPSPLGTVDLRNANGDANLPLNVQDVLAGKGFRRGTVTPTAGGLPSGLRYAPGQEQLARQVTDALGVRLIAEPDPRIVPGTVLVTLGRDFPRNGFGTRPSNPPPVSLPLASPGASTTSTRPTVPDSASPTPRIDADGVTCVN
ncbi:LytR family transcriptional attenuator [Herbihabitans rhizosphaerae]|uniref:LytR family transcriptional attenuator n=1 Tax=Herbihabitans rhizosphaerae TaxID=1872711 RepID=A0A4Q7KG47_9PSEU|nr:LCP family protein [Herbihabitans rhizosphaerae]RZS33888.1 LytR family transcriptional attenuator [Herbihabitans rhizosphaerae]